MKFAVVSSSETTGDSFRITSNTRTLDMKLWPKTALFLKAACLWMWSCSHVAFQNEANFDYRCLFHFKIRYKYPLFVYPFVWLLILLQRSSFLHGVSCWHFHFITFQTSLFSDSLILWFSGTVIICGDEMVLLFVCLFSVQRALIM